MANLSATTPTLAGANCVGTTYTVETVLVAYTSAQSALNFAKLAILFANQTSVASVITFVIGEDFSEIGQGVGDTITMGTSGSASGSKLVGGTSFESARYQNDDGYFSFSIAGTASSILVRAIQLP